MKKNRLIVSLAATATAVAALALPGASPASAATGNKSLATVLAADGAKFDKNRKDFDILDAAVTAVLTENPESPVAVLAQGKQRLTAFLPTDQAFHALAQSLTGEMPATEKATFNALAEAAGLETIETVLLYHVIPGATITSKQALQADGAELETALGETVKVQVVGKGKGQRVILQDKDYNAVNARIVAFDINKGNKQIGHGISRVLRPADL